MSDDNKDKVEPAAPNKVTIQSLLKGLVKYKASDLHVKAGRPPMYRINSELIPTKIPELSPETVKEIAYSTMSNKQVAEFEKNQQIDFGYVLPGVARFRANVYMQKGTVAFVIRVVPLNVPLFDTLGLPASVAELSTKERGLLLITGATGSGKSTTMASLLDHINRHSRNHIVTIEDPIEYVYEDKLSSVSQRELGVDTPSMAMALKAALRQDPDVIMLGEMRDYETMHTALTAAETGHLVISTLHTNSAAQTIDRILDSFPPESKNQTRMLLSSCLVGIVNQRLAKRADGKGRIAVCEVMSKSPTIEKLILENKIDEITPAIEASNNYYKMQSTNQALEKLIRDNIVTVDEALSHSDYQEDLRLKLSGMVGGGQKGVDASQIMDQMKDEMDSAPEIDQEAGTQSGIVLDTGPVQKGLFAEKVQKLPQSGGYSKATASGQPPTPVKKSA
jgi:twitching motility protein PilT